MSRHFVADLEPCPDVTPEQRERGVVCAMFANGATCLSGGECAEALGGRLVVTDMEIEPVPDEPFASDGYWREVPS